MRGYTQAVHPHACGDNFVNALTVVGDCGPPPRLWGQLWVIDRDGVTHRSTPTPVGTTRKPVFVVRGKTVHPHACGDNAPPGGRL